jgi:hypothetical protein
LQPLFFFCCRQVEKSCHKNKCWSQFWGGKKEKKKKRHPWFWHVQKGFLWKNKALICQISKRKEKEKEKCQISTTGSSS